MVFPSDSNSRCQLEWGPEAAENAARRGDVVVIVDVLSFSSAVVTAVQHGGYIYPCSQGDDPRQAARAVGAEAAVRRTEVPAKGRYSLSPLTYLEMTAGTGVVLASPNGAVCSRCAEQAPLVVVGCFLNAQATARALDEMLTGGSGSVTLIACGEVENDAAGKRRRRWAVEDYLGAGAILSYMMAAKSADARVCERAFSASRDELAAILRESPSGDELIRQGFAADVEFVSRLNVYDVVPIMRQGRFEAR